MHRCSTMTFQCSSKPPRLTARFDNRSRASGFSAARSIAVCKTIDHSEKKTVQLAKFCQQVAIGTAAAFVVSLDTTGVAFANEKVAEFAASGLIFKDSVEVVAVDDPDVEGVTIYVSDFKRSLADKLSKDFFSEPSQASVTCAQTGPIKFKDAKRVKVPEGQEVFSERKGLNLFQSKTLRVRRIYDDDRNTLLYIAYSTRLSTASDDGQVSTGRYRTSVCALPIASAPTIVPVAAEAAAAAP